MKHGLRLVFGLGNPGKEYEKTRHNMGFMVLDEIADRFHVKVNRRKRRAKVEEITLDGKALLIKPQTFMNLSGNCVLDFAAYYNVQIEDIIVVYDDIDLPVGTIRVRKGGGPGTHNGMRDIVNKLGDGGFIRVRVGIGAQGEKQDLISHVMGKPRAEEQAALEKSIARAADAVLCLLEEGLEAAQRNYN